MDITFIIDCWIQHVTISGLVIESSFLYKNNIHIIHFVQLLLKTFTTLVGFVLIHINKSSSSTSLAIITNFQDIRKLLTISEVS